MQCVGMSDNTACQTILHVRKYYRSRKPANWIRQKPDAILGADDTVVGRFLRLAVITSAEFIE